MTYSMKVQLLSVRKSDAVDIDSYDEFKELVTDILENLLPKMTIFVDMADIQKRWSWRGFNRGSDDEDVHGDDPSLYDSNGLSDVERELARLRRKLEKKYQNDHDAGYTYVDPDTAESFLLTPQLMKEWCRSMYDGEATINKPPSFVASFDPAKRQVALHPTCIAAGANLPQGPIVFHHVQFNSKSQARPRLPLQRLATPLSFLHPPSHPRFLEHAEKTLGVSQARSFESPMRRNGYGPDIMHLLDNQALEDIGINKGDVLRIKSGASQWWNGPDAKRKRVDSGNAGPSGSNGGGNLPMSPPNKKVSFELPHIDGGAQRFYGPRITPGSPTQRDKKTWYRCLVRNDWVPIPLSYRAVIENEEEPEDDVDREGEAAAALFSMRGDTNS
ncbi:hypothetical protein B0H14DRAFT_3579312 [Mycena olivaceomarginata]|nr:hypothetical protein B0H14DRAFT_3579312 [Mycena olivaceomarginata]